MSSDPSFDRLGLRAELLRAVAAQGYTTPTPIQARAIPPVLAGRDFVGIAQTGTGKTASYVLPILQHLLEHPTGGRRGVRALVVVPTRELAMQVAECTRELSTGTDLRCTAVFGGVGMPAQVAALRRGVDIVVATPGRLLDHAGQRSIDLSGVEVLVLDEADRMLDMGFIRDVRRILALLPARRQNLLFSATFAEGIRALAAGMLRDPEVVDISPRQSAAETVEQSIYRVPREEKTSFLARLIHDGRWEQVLVFTRTKHGADRLAKLLNQARIAAEAIHGNRSQGQRTRALEAFKTGRVRVLVATDVASRGLDISGLPHVVNFDLPQVPEDYVHRIGRTGRAGLTGQAVSLVSDVESALLAAIERLLKRRLPEGAGVARAVIAAVAPERRPPAEPVRAAVDTAPAPVVRPGQGRRRSRRGGRGARTSVAPVRNTAAGADAHGHEPVQRKAPRRESPQPVAAARGAAGAGPNMRRPRIVGRRPRAQR